MAAKKQEHLTHLAISLVKVHQGKKDSKGIREYIHSIAVANALPSDIEAEVYQAAILHDVVEDTKLKLKDLKKLGFSDRTVEIVELLTKDKEFKPSKKEKKMRKELKKLAKKDDKADKKDIKKLRKKITEMKSERFDKFVDSIIGYKDPEIALYAALIKYVDIKHNMTKERLGRYGKHKQKIKKDVFEEGGRKLEGFFKGRKVDVKDGGFGSWLKRVKKADKPRDIFEDIEEPKGRIR